MVTFNQERPLTIMDVQNDIDQRVVMSSLEVETLRETCVGKLKTFQHIR